MAADHFVRLCEALGPEVTQSELVPLFSALMGDAEAEVRTAACMRLAEVSEKIQKPVLMKFVVPCLMTLARDTSQHVRGNFIFCLILLYMFIIFKKIAALACTVSKLAPLMGKEDAVKSLTEVLLQLLKDECSEARLNVISTLDPINKVAGIDSVASQLLPAILELAEDKQWRVRLSIIEKIPLIAADLVLFLCFFVSLFLCFFISFSPFFKKQNRE